MPKDRYLTTRIIARGHLSPQQMLIVDPLRHLKEAFLNNASELRKQRGVHTKFAENSQNEDAIFIWIPKSAGNSILKSLEDFCAIELLEIEAIKNIKKFKGIFTFGHIPLHMLLGSNLIPESFMRKAYKFAFVRNPYDRAISLFEYLKVKKYLPPETTFPIFCSFLESGAYTPLGLYNHRSLSVVNPQYHWLLDHSGNMYADYIGYYENLYNDMKIIFDKMKLTEPKIPHENKSHRSSIFEYYNDYTINIVRKVYKRDFELFGYGDDISNLSPKLKYTEN